MKFFERNCNGDSLMPILMINKKHCVCDIKGISSESVRNFAD